MRHRKHNVRFGRQKSHYKATMRHLVSALIINKSITTTKVKAKETSRVAEKLVTIAKNKTVANQRKAYCLLCDRDIVSILFNEIAPLFKDRNGGYTRVMLTNKRRGDNAQMAILEFVEKPKPAVEPSKKKEAKKKEVVQPEAKPKIEKQEEPKKEKPIPQTATRQPEKPKAPKPKPGLFRRLFGRGQNREG